MADERDERLEDAMDESELQEAAERPSSRDGGPSVRDTYQTAKRMAQRRSQALQAGGTLAGKVGSRFIPVAGWLLLAKDLLANPVTRRLLLLGVLLAFTVLGAAVFILVALLSPFLKGVFGTQPTDAIAVTVEEDMDLVRFLKCLDELAPEATALPQSCYDDGKKGASGSRERIARLRAEVEAMTDAERKAKALEAITAFETELTAIEQNLTNVKVLREHAPKFREAKQQLDAIVGQLGVQLSVALDVPGIDQPDSGWCGYTSVAMVAQYFANKTGVAKMISLNQCTRGRHAAVLNAQLSSIFAAAGTEPIQYTDHETDPRTDPTFFPTILKSLAKGAPVILYTSLYAEANGGKGHVIVLTGYDPAKQVFIANNPNIPTEKDVSTIAGVTLDEAGIKAHAEYYLGPGFVSYDGSRSFR